MIALGEYSTTPRTTELIRLKGMLLRLQRELYELRRDPYQLVNVADDPSYAPVLRRLSASLATYRTA